MITAHRMLQKHAVLALAFAPLLTVSGCSTGGARRGAIDGVAPGWVIMPQFTTTVQPNDKVFLQYKDPVSAPEFRKLEQMLGAKLKREYKLQIVSRPEEANYACVITLRHFDANPSGDHGVALLNELNKTPQWPGGLPDWLDAEGNTVEAAANIGVIDLQQQGKENEWLLLFDVVVGEKGGLQTAKDKFVQRAGRFRAYMNRNAITREDAAWMVKYGHVRRPSKTDPKTGDPTEWEAEPAVPENLLEHLLPMLPLATASTDTDSTEPAPVQPAGG